MRTATEGGDSLELLLDTICNVFGAIVLVALLVVLQTQVTVHAVGRSAPDDPRVRRAEFELSRVERERTSLEAEVAAVGTAVPELDHALAINGRRSEFLDAIDAARQRLQRERQRAAQVEEGLRTAQTKVEAEGERVRRLGKDVEAANARAGAVPESFRRDVRLPIWHDQVAPLQRSILIVGRRAFALPEDCVEEVLSESGWRYRPRNGSGRPIMDDASSRAAMSALMAGRTPGGSYVSFWVSDRDESFETFQRLRAAVTAMTYEYTVSPYEQDKGLLLGRGRPKAE